MTMPLLSILIIEPHPLMRDALHSALQAEPDLRVIGVTANSAEALLRTANISLCPDVILLAIGNPGLDDLQAIAIWRRLLPASVLIALFTDDWPRQWAAAVEAGAQVVIGKTTPRAELLSLIRAGQRSPISNAVG